MKPFFGFVKENEVSHTVRIFFKFYIFSNNYIVLSFGLFDIFPLPCSSLYILLYSFHLSPFCMDPTWELEIKLRYNSCYLQTPPFVHTIYHPFIHSSFLPTYFSILYPIIHHSLFHSFIFHHTVPFILYTFFFMFSVILHALVFMFSVILYTFFFMFSVILYAFSLFLFHLHFSNV